MGTIALVVLVAVLALAVFAWGRKRPAASVHPTLVAFRDAVEANVRQASRVRDLLQEREMLPSGAHPALIDQAVAELAVVAGLVSSAHRAWRAAGAPER